MRVVYGIIHLGLFTMWYEVLRIIVKCVLRNIDEMY